jgi:hypothetical protein
LVTSFYEKINSSTNFNDNILIPNITLAVPNNTYSGFNIYSTGGIWNNNSYLSNYKQFDYYGVLIKTISIYSGFNFFKLSAKSLGAENTNNIGQITQISNITLDSAYYYNSNDSTGNRTLGNVTTQVRQYLESYINKNTPTTLGANNSTFGDTLPGIRKTLYLNFKLPNGSINTISYLENSTLSWDSLVSSIGLINKIYTIYTITQIQDPSCFNEGTKILCLNKNLEEQYIPIEQLRKGDVVKSYKHGYRKIDLICKNIMINNPNFFECCMYKMKKTNNNGLIDDLIITGWHSILVDDLRDYKEINNKRLGSIQMIDDKYLLLSSISNDFNKIEEIKTFTYYFFILENNGSNDERFGIWANGILTETPSKNHFNSKLYLMV